MRSRSPALKKRYLRTLCAGGLAGIGLPTAAQAATASDGAVAAQDAGAADEIVVTGSRAAREQAIERKRALPTIADVVASDDIGKLPDFNTAEALQRLPGISVQIDQGEPRYVIVRGIDPNLNQVTIDGNLAGIPEAEGRRVALDTIPSDLVSAIEVVKAVTPDYDANAIGGSINLITPTAFDRPDSYTHMTARGNYNAKSEKFGFGGSATHGQRFGPDGQFGVVIAGSYLKRFIDSDLAEPTGYQSFATGANRLSAPTNFILYDYRIMRERIGGILNLDWRPSDDVRVYVRNIYNEFTDHEERDQFNIALVSGAPAPTVLNSTQISYPNARATRQFRQNNQTQKLYNISPGAEFRFGAAELDLNYTFAHAQEHTPIRDDLEFRTLANRTATLDVTDPLPRFVVLDPTLFNPAAFPLRRIRQRREKIDEDLNTFRADLKVSFTDDEKSFVKIGGKFIKRVKDRDNSQTQRDAVGVSTFAGTGAVLATPEDFYEGRYAFGPAMDYRKVLDYYAANPGLIALNALQTAINERALDYHINEKIYAGYGMVNLAIGDLTAIGGVRIERTEGRYDAFSIRRNGTVITPLTFDRDYTHVLPSIHLNYRARPDILIRAAWTNTIGRPNYDATVPTFTEDNGAGTAGNSDLKPYTSMGLDFSAEYYPGEDSILSLGIFYKRLKNPIFTQQIQNTTFAGVALTTLSQPQNADRGKLFGIEVNAQKRFTFLPAPFDGLGLSVNGTYVDSRVRVPGRESEDIPFFRQSKWIANAALFYERGPFEARVALAYRSPFIENVGSPTQGTTADIYQYGRTVIDARVSYDISTSIEIFASLANINEAPLNYYQTSKRQTYSREIYSLSGDFGVSVRF